MSKHIAFVPARSGSKGYPGKNYKFFDSTASFIKESELFDRVIVSSNDSKVIKKAKKYKFEIHERKKIYAGANVSIKNTLINVINETNLGQNDIIWLFYIPILYKSFKDFKKAKKIFNDKKINSMISFMSSEVHPYNFWKYDKGKKKLSQFFKNDIFRRQDMPKAFIYHHYICGFKVLEIDRLNSELINENTHPFFLDVDTQSKLIEIDTQKNYLQWLKIIKDEKTKN